MLIFIARIADVSLGTIRVIFAAKGFSMWAPILGFFEVFIWLLVIRQIMSNLSNPLCFMAYAAGFATGTHVGIRIEDMLRVGKVIIRIHTKRDSGKLLKALRKLGYPVVVINAENHVGRIKILSVVIKRQTLPRLVEIMRQYNPHAVYSIEDIRYAIDEVVRPRRLKRDLVHSRKDK